LSTGRPSRATPARRDALARRVGVFLAHNFVAFVDALALAIFVAPLLVVIALGEQAGFLLAFHLSTPVVATLLLALSLLVIRA